LAAGTNNLDLQGNQKSSLGLLTVGSVQPPTVIHCWMAYSWPLAPAGPITKFHLRPQFLEKSLLYWPVILLACPNSLIIRLFTPFQEISYSLAFSGLSP
jgi:hypothetical protein